MAKTYGRISMGALKSLKALAIEYSYQQGLLRRKLDVEDLFDAATIGLK